jgi:hypothetical protein
MTHLEFIYRRAHLNVASDLWLEFAMLDLAYLIGGCAFFALAVLYTIACDHL